MTITKLVEPAPFTAFFTRESPGRAVVWLGYEIVKAYISRSGDSLEELMENNSYRSILQQAKFNP